MDFKPEKYFIKVTLIENDYVNYTKNVIGFTHFFKKLNLTQVIFTVI